MVTFVQLLDRFTALQERNDRFVWMIHARQIRVRTSATSLLR